MSCKYVFSLPLFICDCQVLCQFYSGTVFLYICVYLCYSFAYKEEEEKKKKKKKKKKKFFLKPQLSSTALSSTLSVLASFFFLFFGGTKLTISLLSISQE